MRGDRKYLSALLYGSRCGSVGGGRMMLGSVRWDEDSGKS